MTKWRKCLEFSGSPEPGRQAFRRLPLDSGRGQPFRSVVQQPRERRSQLGSGRGQPFRSVVQPPREKRSQLGSVIEVSHSVLYTDQRSVVQQPREKRS